MTAMGSISDLNAQIDRSFWKPDAEIDEFYGNAATARGAVSQRASLATIMDRISKLNHDPSPENFAFFGDCLRKLSRGNVYQLKERFEVYDKVQSTMVAIPGHARHFADEIKREQKKVANYPTVTGPRVSYDHMRGWNFLTMRHLPSPETIAVLGDFLADDKDQPGRRDPSKSYDYDIPPANSVYSAGAINEIGLRNPPIEAKTNAVYPEDLLAATRAWWEEVRSGQRTFSFKGQAVEYRFRPDGTWETIPIANPRDHGPKPVPAAKASEKQASPLSTVDPVSPEVHSMWWWIAGAGGVLVAAAFALFRKSSKPH